MQTNSRNILKIIFIFFYCTVFSQSDKLDSLRGNFTYLLSYKPNKLHKNIISQETFSLQVTDNQAIFVSENKLKFDSIFTAQFKMNQGNIDMRNFPTNQSMSRFVIIQNNQDSKYYESIGRTKLFYSTPIITNWKLTNETKIINSITCKKAEVRFKGRNWTAWYSIDIPFPYGPYKFSGLPGLIIKITDETGDYDFELIKSVSSKNLKGKIIDHKLINYNSSKEVKKEEFVKAKSDFKDNTKQQLKNMGTIFSEDKENPYERKQRMELEEKKRNPLELEE